MKRITILLSIKAINEPENGDKEILKIVNMTLKKAKVKGKASIITLRTPMIQRLEVLFEPGIDVEKLRKKLEKAFKDSENFQPIGV